MMNAEGPASLIIFDCDGVLVDSEIIAAHVLANALTEIGFPLTADECIARYTGISMASVVERVEAQWERRLPPDFLEQMRAGDEEAFRADLRPIPGVRDVLLQLPQRRCVASSGRVSKLRLTLTLTGLLPLFEPHVYSVEMVKHGKPAPDLFLHAARQMGTPAGRCIVIEDSIAGVSAAVAAGMWVIGFAGGSHCRCGHDRVLAEVGATDVFSRMAELPRILDGLTRG
jgi:HAD superfamily hydrolase (TIGR01509 family)